MGDVYKPNMMVPAISLAQRQGCVPVDFVVQGIHILAAFDSTESLPLVGGSFSCCLVVSCRPKACSRCKHPRAL